MERRYQMASPYKNLNPQSIAELSDREMRRAYSELRSIARKRADRLEAQGYEAARFDPLANIPEDDLEYELARVAAYVQSPGSSLKVAKKEREQASMAAHGYNIQDYNSFGKFMDSMRYRYRNRKLPDSGLWADIYQQAERRKMSIGTLQREFGKYLNDQQESERLRDALEQAPERTRGRDRLTAKNLRSILEDL